MICSKRPRKAIVTGMIATYPLGGVAWDYGQYALALERLGFEVYYLEDTGLDTYDPRVRCYVDDPTYGVAFLRRSLGFLSETLARRWHFRSASGPSHGIDASDFRQIVAEADLLLNVSGSTLLRDPWLRCPCKVLIDTDPGWNHFRNYPEQDRKPMWNGGHGFRAHDVFFTYAQRIGRADCVLPTFGLEWHPTRPPVMMDRWQSAPGGTRWTTVMTWKNFSEPIAYRGIAYGTKEMEFERIEALPQRVPFPLEVAIDGTDWQSTRSRWEQRGWHVLDAPAISGSAQSYRDYIRQSRGEFSVAKNVYVATRSGWFSCRSVCYLAAGLPVVVQDTGFAEIIPCGEGLVAFATMEQAAEGLRRVEADYARHCVAARRLAREHFAGERVLGDLLAQAGVGVPG